MSSFTEWFRKLGHRLCKTQVPDKFLLPQLAGNLEAAEARLFKRLVQKGRLAPFYPGYDEPIPETEVMECPICCTYYRVMNKTKCCGQRLCSECIVQIRIGCPFANIACPFCKKSGLDVEISEGKSEMEKKEDMLDEQRFAESRRRQRAEDETAPPLAQVENTDAAETHENFSFHRDDTTSNPAGTDQGDSASSPYNLPTPRSVEDEYRQEYAALSQGFPPTNLNASEMQRCEEYLGVRPEDLGLRLEEFNDLLLEQTLISSMIEMRTTEAEVPREVEELEPPGDNLELELAVRGGPSSEGGPKEETSSPSLRSHSLPLPPASPEPLLAAAAEGSEAPRWSLENVLRQVQSASPFTFLSASAGEPSTSAYAPAPPSPFSPQTEGAPQEGEGSDDERSGENGSSASEPWKSLLNSLAGFDDVRTDFRMIRVRFDDPEVDAHFNPPPQRQTPPALVENPDGSMALTAAPEERATDPPRLEQTIEEADRQQVDAIAEADARLRAAFRQS